jgi:hypothetical protein
MTGQSVGISKKRRWGIYFTCQDLQLKRLRAKFHDRSPIELRRAVEGFNDGYCLLCMWTRIISLPECDAAYQKVRAFTWAEALRPLTVSSLDRPYWDTFQIYSCE